MSGFVEKPEPVQVPGLVHLHTGKVRDLYRNDAGDLVMVASDRISAYDWVLPTDIPDKGRVLTQLSLWWFDQLADLVPEPRHLHRAARPAPPPTGRAAPLVLQVACGCCRSSAWPAATSPAPGLAEYDAYRTVCGIALPEGLVDGSELPAPIFTPATKAAVGEHDENVSYEEVARQVGAETAGRAARRRPSPSTAGPATSPGSAGIILADTKFEFGFDGDGGWSLGDEVLTPDSSRFWPADTWEPGRAAALLRQAVHPRLADLAGLRLGPRRRACRRRRCRRRSSTRPARSTSRRTSG